MKTTDIKQELQRIQAEIENDSYTYEQLSELIGKL